LTASIASILLRTARITGRRADEDDALSCAAFDKTGFFGQEAIAGWIASAPVALAIASTSSASP
jgi:hypothetical protein